MDKRKFFWVPFLKIWPNSSAFSATPQHPLDVYVHICALFCDTLSTLLGIVNCKEDAVASVSMSPRIVIKNDIFLIKPNFKVTINSSFVEMIEILEKSYKRFPVKFSMQQINLKSCTQFPRNSSYFTYLFHGLLSAQGSSKC